MRNETDLSPTLALATDDFPGQPEAVELITAYNELGDRIIISRTDWEKLTDFVIDSYNADPMTYERWRAQRAIDASRARIVADKARMARKAEIAQRRAAPDGTTAG